MVEPPTLREVARRAGVSLSTASQALNNKPNVAPETRARVLEAAVELGYHQQVRIATPLTHKLSVIGFVIRTIYDQPMPVNPFYAHVLAGAERECQRLNLSLMYANVEVDTHNRALSLPPLLFDDRVDALLVVGWLVPQLIEEARQRLIVLVDAYAPDQIYDSVVSDNLNGAYQAVTHLIRQGHRHIGLIGSRPDAYPSIRERRKGYMRALKHHGIADTYIEDGLLTRADGREAALRLLERCPQITAIFSCNDEVAMGVLSAAEASGRVIPDDLSLVGFDNIDLTREVRPALTTVHVDKELMGAMAVRHLRERAEDPLRTTVTSVLTTRLVTRDSVRDLRAAEHAEPPTSIPEDLPGRLDG